MHQTYWVRFGVMRRVGLFSADSDAYARGETIVIRSRRGTELGEVLAPANSTPSGVAARVLRAAGPEDLDRARRADLERPDRLAACERIFRDGTWPLELIDVEPLLDDRRTVLHYLGPHHLDDSGLREAFRAGCGLDVLFEPAGLDAHEEIEADEAEGHGSCGAEGCGGGGCGSGGEGHGGGCSGCAVKQLVGRRRAVAAGA